MCFCRRVKARVSARGFGGGGFVFDRVVRASTAALALGSALSVRERRRPLAPAPVSGPRVSAPVLARARPAPRLGQASSVRRRRPAAPALGRWQARPSQPRPRRSARTSPRATRGGAAKSQACARARAARVGRGCMRGLGFAYRTGQHLGADVGVDRHRVLWWRQARAQLGVERCAPMLSVSAVGSAPWSRATRLRARRVARARALRACAREVPVQAFGELPRHRVFRLPAQRTQRGGELGCAPIAALSDRDRARGEHRVDVFGRVLAHRVHRRRRDVRDLVEDVCGLAAGERLMPVTSS